MSEVSYAKRLQRAPKIRVPVLHIAEAVDAFERAVSQQPEYGDDIVNGFVVAEIYWNRRTTWQTLRELAARGIVWMPQEDISA